MSTYPTSKKIDFNIENGLRFRAAIQLGSLIANNPNNLELRDQLANLYYQAGFYDAAGKFWILNASKEPHVQKCVELYEKSVNYSGYTILQDIKFKGDKALLNEFAQNKLKQLEADSLEKVKHIPTFIKEKKEEPQEVGQSSTPHVYYFGCIIAFILVVFCIVSFLEGAKIILSKLF